MVVQTMHESRCQQNVLRGPTFNDRIKPDVVAPGNMVLSAYSSDTPDDPDSLCLIVFNGGTVPQWLHQSPPPAFAACCWTLSPLTAARRLSRRARFIVRRFDSAPHYYSILFQQQLSVLLNGPCVQLPCGYHHLTTGPVQRVCVPHRGNRLW